MNKLNTIFIISLLITANYCTGSETVKSLVPEAEAIVLNSLKSSDARIRANAVEVISEGKKTEMMENVVALLDDPAVAVRFAAVVAIGDMLYGPGEAKLKPLLKDPDLNVAVATAYALYKIGGDIKYLKPIEDSADSPDQTVKANVAMLLGKLKSKHSLPILHKLKDDLNAGDAVALNATEAIARIEPNDEIYKKIWTMLISVYADKRYMGVRAMGAFGGVKGANAIITLLDDEVAEVRLAAAEQLGMIGDNSGQIVILEYLNNPEQAEKPIIDRRNVLAALAIGSIGTEPLIAHLPKLLKNESQPVRLAAAESIFILATGH
ncbi:MAG: hypothetical protein WC496_07195 [Phycisphaerae bacterium]|jgi:HEAT repeat protein